MNEAHYTEVVEPLVNTIASCKAEMAIKGTPLRRVSALRKRAKALEATLNRVAFPVSR